MGVAECLAQMQTCSALHLSTDMADAALSHQHARACTGSQTACIACKQHDLHLAHIHQEPS